MTNYYYKYLLYKGKYLNLKKQIRENSKEQIGGHLPPIVEHGIGFNIKKFISIIDNGGIYSINGARNKNIDILKGHLNATNGDECISVSIPKSLTSQLYSVEGITFIINTNGLVDCGDKYGKMDGEKYILENIPLTNIIAIYIPLSVKDLPLSNFKLCNLTYGTATIIEKINYQFKLCESNQECLNTLGQDINQLITKFNTAESLISEEYYTEARKLSREQQTHTNLTALKTSIQKKYYDPLELECTKLFLILLSHELKTDVTSMTLDYFIRGYLQVKGHNIPIEYQL